MNFARRLADLMLFRAGPQEMPGTQATLVISAGVYCILLIVQIALIEPLTAAVTQAVLASVLLFVYVAGLLRLRGLPNRLPQTATALFTAGAVLRVIVLAPTRSLQSFLHSVSSAADPANVPLPPLPLMLVYFLVGAWGLAVYAYIYKHALDISILLGVMAAIGFEVLLVFVFALIG